jgi:hypothetical protein
MQDIESVVLQNYEKSMLYFEQKHTSLFNKLKALELLLNEGKYPQKYDLEFKDGYFDVIDLASNTFLYNTDSYTYSHKLVDEVNFKKNEHVIETFYNHNFDEESVANAKKLTANHTHSTTAPIIYYYNKNIDKSMLMQKMYKFMFLGVGLGLHIEDTVRKTDADVFLILEDDIELFRLSLFTCNYQEAFSNREAFFGVAQNSAEYEDTFLRFYDYAFIRNHYLKFSLFSSRDEVQIKKIQTSILSRSEHCYSHAALLEKGYRVLEKLNQEYKFFSMLKKDEKYFDDKPILVLGAGPSLGANKEWLKQHQSKFIIIAPFATLRILYNLNIAPDIIVHIDEGDIFADRDMKLYEGKEDFFKNSLFVFNASIPQIFFDTFDKDSIYLLEDRTSYKLNDNYVEIASVGEASYAIALSLTHQDVYLLGLDMALGDDGSSHSKTHSTKNKADTSRADKLDEVADLRKTVLTVKGNFIDRVATIPLFSMSISMMNQQTRKYKSQNQNIYNLSNGAYFEQTTPLNIESIEFEGKEDAEYGVVQSEYGITFVGYYKKINSNEIYDVDVYIDGEYIESLRADKRHQKVEELFDVNSNGFEFVLEEKYFDKAHLLEFKESKSGKLLMDGSVKTISMQDEKFDEFRFMDSVEHVDAEKIKDMYCPNAIGFMATEENLRDRDFVNYIKELHIKFPQLIFKAFYFNNKQKELIENIFIHELNRFKFIKPLDIYTLASETEFYFESEKTIEVLKTLILYSKKILALTYSTSLKTKNVIYYSGQAFENNVVFVKPDLFGYTKNDIDKADGNVLKLQFNKALENLDEPISLDDNKNVYDLYYSDTLDYSLKNRKFKEEMIKSSSIIWKYNSGVL